MIRTANLKASGLLYDEDARYGEDYELWLRLIGRGKFTNIRRPLVQYRRHQQSLSVINGSLEESALADLRRKALRLVNLEPTDLEMAAHCCLADGAVGDRDVTREQLLSWCQKLQVANAATGFTAPPAMASVLRERLLKVESGRGLVPYLRHKALRIRDTYITRR